jgi:hypothetical protein
MTEHPRRPEPFEQARRRSNLSVYDGQHHAGHVVERYGGFDDDAQDLFLGHYCCLRDAMRVPPCADGSSA